MEDEIVDQLENWESTSASNVISLAIVGRTGNGKSATGNTILGRQGFISFDGFSSVTCTSELKSAILKDGRAVNVIDTPGFMSTDSDFVEREIIKCINLANDGLHAVLMVFKLSNRMTQEEENVIQNMKTLFGEKILDYMIVVLTGGDGFKDGRNVLKECISQSTKGFKDFIHSCKNRVVLFDNKTTDKIKIEAQVKHLFSVVDSVIASNGGKTFSNEIFTLAKEDKKLKSRVEKLEKELIARNLKAEDIAKNKELQEVKEELKRAKEELKKYHEEFQKFRRQARSKCAIL